MGLLRRLRVPLDRQAKSPCRTAQVVNRAQKTSVREILIAAPPGQLARGRFYVTFLFAPTTLTTLTRKQDERDRPSPRALLRKVLEQDRALPVWLPLATLAHQHHHHPTGRN